MRRVQILMTFAALSVALGLSPGCPSVTVDPEPGACVPGVTRCSTDARCDDGDPCTTDTCDAGCCENTPECKTDRQCDDGDPCTTDICDAGCCGSASIDCDDRQFCTGTENCDPVSGECISSGNPCDPNEVCDDSEDECNPLPPRELSVSISGCPDQLGQGDSTDLVAVTLNARGTVTYQWDLLSGSGSLDNPTSRTPILTASDSAEIVIRVTATDGTPSTEARSATATCTIDVTPNNTESKRRLPACFRLSASAIISIDLHVPADVLVVGLRENPPSGWIVSNISNGGKWDVTNKAVKWFFFDDELPRTVSYTITPSSDGEGVACFSGRVNFDGDTEQAISGHKCVGPCSAG